MSESAIERTARALDLIPFITANPGLSIGELAQTFNCSPAQMFKDLEMLFMCGLPGYTHLELIDMELNQDYVSINNPQNLDRPRKLSASEVVALTLGLDILIPIISDVELRERAVLLKGKFSELLVQEQSGEIATVVGEIVATATPFDSTFSEAIKKSCGLDISYRSARTDQLRQRLVYPVRTYSERGYLYSVAFCTLAGEERHFRHDRVNSAKINSTSLTDKGSQAQVEAQVEERVPLLIRVALSKRNRFFIEAHRSIVQSTLPHGNSLEVTFEVGDKEWIIRELLALPGSVEILEPITVRDEYFHRLDAILELYR